MRLHVSVFISHVYIFFIWVKVPPCKISKKKTTRIDIFQQTLLCIWTSEKINISPCCIQTCNFDFAANSSYHYNLPNPSAIRLASYFSNFIFQQTLLRIWTSERSKFCHAVCIFITLILHQITRTITTQHLAEHSPAIIVYEVNNRVSLDIAIQ